MRMGRKMSYEIFSYGNGQALSDLLNGIAAIMDDSGYKSFINIGVILAFGSLLLTTVFDLKLARVAKWYAMMMTIYTALIVPKVDVLITDPVLRNSQYAVSHVPVGLAYILSTLTTIEYNLTNAVETALHVPEDLSYNSTGMLMASDMVRKASSFKILDQNLSNNIRSYIQQCIQYDILHGKYSVNELFNSGNIWRFTSEYSSPARAFIYNGAIMTCQAGSEKLTIDWEKEIRSSMGVFGKRLFGNNLRTTPEEQLSKYLQVSYSHLANISKTASDIMQQNMMINAFHDGVINNAAELGAAAAVESYAVARATQNSRSAYKVSGEVAGRQLPYLKNVMQLLIIGSFIVILPLFFFPSGVLRMRHFLEILASLSLWAPLYAILNLQMTSAGRWKILGLASQPSMTDKAAITIANLPGIEQIAADQAILAGYLALSIPLISYGLIKSSMHSFNSLASGVMSVAQSSAGHAAEEATTGNYSLGNVSLENTNAFNTSSFHEDSNVRASSGSTMVQALDGTTNTLFSDGSLKTDHREAGSNFLTSTNFGNNVQSVLSKSFNESISSAQTQAVDLTNTMTSALHNTYDLATQVGNSTSSDASSSMGYSANQIEALNEYRNQVDSIAAQTGASTNEVIAVAANLHANKGIIPGFIGVGASLSGTSDASMSNQDVIREELSKTQGLSSVIDTATRVASDSSHRTTEDSSTRLSDSIKNDLSTADSLRESISANLQQAESKQEALSFAQTNSAAINTAGDKIVFDALRDTVNPDTGRNYTTGDISALDLKEPHKFQEVIAPIVEKHAQGILAKSGVIEEKGAKIQNSYETRNQEIELRRDQLTGTHADNKENLKNGANIKPVNSTLKSTVDAKIKDTKDDISNAKEASINKEREMKSKFETEKDKSLSIKAYKNASERVQETRQDLRDFLGINDDK